MLILFSVCDNFVSVIITSNVADTTAFRDTPNKSK